MRFFAYVPMQMLGAMAGAAIASLGNGGAFKAFGGAANGVSSGVLPVRAFGLETMSTFILMFTILAATDTKRYPNLNHLPVRPPSLAQTTRTLHRRTRATLHVFTAQSGSPLNFPLLPQRLRVLNQQPICIIPTPFKRPAKKTASC